MFKLSREAIDYQLTVHVDNLFHGDGISLDSVMRMEVVFMYLDNPNKGPLPGSVGFRLQQLIDHYGLDTCRDWFTEFYDYGIEVAS